jgi:hypothetical protein
VDGTFCGRGVYRWGSGDVYEGEYKENMPHGIGKKVYSGGGLEEGLWERGEFLGCPDLGGCRALRVPTVHFSVAVSPPLLVWVHLRARVFAQATTTPSSLAMAARCGRTAAPTSASGQAASGRAGGYSRLRPVIRTRVAGKTTSSRATASTSHQMARTKGSTATTSGRAQESTVGMTAGCTKGSSARAHSTARGRCCIRTGARGRGGGSTTSSSVRGSAGQPARLLLRASWRRAAAVRSVVSLARVY